MTHSSSIKLIPAFFSDCEAADMCNQTLPRFSSPISRLEYKGKNYEKGVNIIVPKDWTRQWRITMTMFTPYAQLFDVC